METRKRIVLSASPWDERKSALYKTFLSHKLREKAFLQGRKKIMDGFLCGLFIAY